MKIFETVLKLFGWLAITLAVTLGAGIISFLIYIEFQTNVGKIAAISILALGFIAGGIWATKIWIKQGTIEWLSTIRR